MGQYDDEVMECLGKEPVIFILDAVSSHEIDVDQGVDIAKMMSHRVRGELQRKRNNVNFRWVEREMRHVLSEWFSEVAPITGEEKQDMRMKLVSILKEVNLNVIAKKIEKI